jgi:YidC/Oxa1 family membrane protein insertase
MDKRSLLAIVVTFLILFAWQAFFMGPRQRELARQRAVELREKQRADSLAAAAAAATGGAKKEAPAAAPSESMRPDTTRTATEFFIPGGETGRESRITVLTDRAKIVLTNVGGEVESVTLNAFQGWNGRPVELVPPGAEGGMVLRVLEAGRWETTSRLRFDASVDGTPVADSAEVILGEGKDKVEVTFTRAGPSGESIEKRFTFSRSGYAVGVAISLKREGEMAATTAYSLGWECGLATTEANARLDERRFAALGRIGDEFYQVPMTKFSKENHRTYEGTIVWAAARTKYFLSSLITAPDSRNSGTLELLGDRSTNFIGFSIGYPFRGDPRLVEDSFTWYVGPLDMNVLKSYGIGLEKAIDLGRLRFLSVAILKLMVWMERIVPNYGVVIIVLSVLTKLLFYRLTHKSFRAMKDMQRIQPRLKEVQEKYKDDRDRMNKEVMKVYKEAGVSPLGGCLPLVLQMPVFIALYNVLSNTIELRDARFVGWINNLSAPDVLFKFGSKLPLLGNEFHLLPILMGAAMVYQSRLSGSPTGDGVAASQTKMMNYLMPIIFTIFFYSMPSGLVLYWLVNNVLSIVQQYYVQKELEAEDAAGAATAGAAAADPGARGSAGASDESGRSSSRDKNIGTRGKKSKRRILH